MAPTTETMPKVSRAPESHASRVKPAKARQPMQASEPNHPPTAGNTPLHFASWKGDAARADALLNSDAVDALALNSRGQSPVHLAAAAGHAGVNRRDFRVQLTLTR